MVRIGSVSDVAEKRDCEPAVAFPGGNATRYLENGCSVVGWPINPGLYAGRIGDRVKIGQPINVAQRVDSFKFDELIGVKPLAPSVRSADEHPEDYALAVKPELMARERAIHGRLATHRIVTGRRANANEWFRLDDELIRVLFDKAGYTV
jgi:hypothetical protein